MAVPTSNTEPGRDGGGLGREVGEAGGQLSFSLLKDSLIRCGRNQWIAVMEAALKEPSNLCWCFPVNEDKFRKHVEEASVLSRLL